MDDKDKTIDESNEQMHEIANAIVKLANEFKSFKEQSEKNHAELKLEIAKSESKKLWQAIATALIASIATVTTIALCVYFLMSKLIIPLYKENINYYIDDRIENSVIEQASPNAKDKSIKR